MTQAQILKNILDALINNGVVLSANDLCKKIGFNQPNFNKILLGDRNRITPDLRLKLGRFFGVNKEYIASGKGEMFQNAENIDKIDTGPDPSECDFLREQNKTLKDHNKSLLDHIDTLKITMQTLNYLLVKQDPANPLEVKKLAKKP